MAALYKYGTTIMITKEEIKKIAFQTRLDAPQIEKDYVLGWVLCAIAQHPILSDLWVFKGGTCLRKIFFENYRYSEDLDFTIIQQTDSDRLIVFMNEISDFVYSKSGIEIDNKRTVFDANTNPSNQTIVQGRIYYRGPVSPQSPRQWPRIKFDLTSDEVIVTPTEKKQIIHPYSDHQLITPYHVSSYSSYDIFAEKLRAFFERTRPRDLYDVVELHKRLTDIDMDILKECFIKKCAFKNITNLSIDQIQVDACEASWNSQLAHQIYGLSEFQYYYNDFNKMFKSMRLT